MGFNFRAGPPDDILGDEGATAAKLRAQFGEELPLGRLGETFSLGDEIAWSWWSELQGFAAERLGEAGSVQIRGVDAWQGVYVDAEVERELIGEARAMGPGRMVVVRRGIWERLKGAMGIGPREDAAGVEPAGSAAVARMVEAYGARAGEQGTMQVGSLRKLMVELEALLAVLSVEATEEAVEALRRWYSEDDARCEEDGHVQCLCHAWLTGRRAPKIGAPLWLVK